MSSPAHGKTAIDGKPTAYVCIGPQCSLPVTDPAALVETVKAARARHSHDAHRIRYHGAKADQARDAWPAAGR